jgi:hypothetical protein
VHGADVRLVHLFAAAEAVPEAPVEGLTAVGSGGEGDDSSSSNGGGASWSSDRWAEEGLADTWCVPESTPVRIMYYIYRPCV